MIGLDWIAGVLTIAANEALARKMRLGWVIHVFNAFLWAWIVYHAKQYGFLAMEAVFLAQATWALWRWRDTAASAYCICAHGWFWHRWNRFHRSPRATSQSGWETEREAR